MKKILTTLMLLLVTTGLFARGNAVTDDAGIFYSNGRIYVVVVCVAIILLGLLAYLFSIDRRLKKLEKK